MTLIVSTDVQCEAPDCRDWIGGATAHGQVRAREARERAAAAGWVRRMVDGRLCDLCPHHASR